MNEDPDKRFDSTLLKARGIYAKDFQRYCNELCLSPQARAKIANIPPAPIISVIRWELMP